MIPRHGMFLNAYVMADAPEAVASAAAPPSRAAIRFSKTEVVGSEPSEMCALVRRSARRLRILKHIGGGG